MATEWDLARATAIIADHAAMPGAAIPILHALQHEFGFVPKQAQALIADALNLSRAEIHGLVSFYHDFRHEPAGRHTLKLCRAEACQASGSTGLARRILARYGLEWGGTTADGSLTVEPVYCLGLCACSPAALLDGEPLGRVDEAMLMDVLDEARAA